MEQLDVQQKRPVNAWTREQKLAVLFLGRLYFNSNWEDLRCVFQKAFHSDLLSRGFFKPRLVSCGITKGALRAQQIELRRNKSTEYVEIYLQTSFDELEDRFSSLNARLLRAARDEGVNLVARQSESVSLSTRDDPIQTSSRQRSPSVSDAETESTLLGDLYDSDEDEIFLQNPRRSISNPTQPRNRIPDIRIPKHDGLPFLAFRVYSERSAGVNSKKAGFKAGAFVSTAPMSYEPIPLSHDPRLVRYAAVHFNRQLDENDQFIPSPFISISDSLIWAISICVQLHKDGIDSRIVMLNTFAIEAPIFEARCLCEDVVNAGLNKFTNYKAAHEYLVWEQILPGPAIVGDVSFNELYQLYQTDRDVGEILQMELISRWSMVATIRARLNPPNSDTRQTARAIAKLLKFFKTTIHPNDRLVNNFIRVILQNWRLAADLDSWRENDAFIAALEETIHAPTKAPKEQRIVPRQSHTSGMSPGSGVFVTSNYMSADIVPATPTDHTNSRESVLSLGLPTPESNRLGRAISESQRNALLNSPYELNSDFMECDSPCCRLSSRL